MPALSRASPLPQVLRLPQKLRRTCGSGLARERAGTNKKATCKQVAPFDSHKTLYAVASASRRACRLLVITPNTRITNASAKVSETSIRCLGMTNMVPKAKMMKPITA